MVVTLLYSLAGGMLVILITARTDQVSWRFLRLLGLIVFVLAVGATTWLFSRTASNDSSLPHWTKGMGVALAVGAAGVVFTSPFAASAGRIFRTACFVGGIAGLSAATLCAVGRLGQEPAHGAPLVMVAANQALGALLLGSITVAWLLGHAYLTATKMTLAPLRHFSRLLMWSVGARAAFLLISLAAAWWFGSGAEPSIVFRIGQAWLILTLRVAVGVVGVGVFAWMVTDCVRLRATQSATGILYFGSLFAYIGELASQQLLTECGWPL